MDAEVPRSTSWISAASSTRIPGLNYFLMRPAKRLTAPPCRTGCSPLNDTTRLAPDRRRDGSPTVDLLRPGVLLADLVAERLGHVAHRRARPVGDDVCDLGGVVAPVTLVDVLDHTLSLITFNVDVDVGWAVALHRQEPLEQQPERHRVGGGDTSRVAHRRVGGAAPTLAEDVRLPAELDEVPHHEEVAGEPEVLDHVELVIDRAPRPGRRAATGPRRGRDARRTGGPPFSVI